MAASLANNRVNLNVRAKPLTHDPGDPGWCANVKLRYHSRPEHAEGQRSGITRPVGQVATALPGHRGSTHVWRPERLVAGGGEINGEGGKESHEGLSNSHSLQTLILKLGCLRLGVLSTSLSCPTSQASYCNMRQALMPSSYIISYCS